MIYFLDTSAFLKRYLPEAGSEIIHNIFTDEENILVVSAITLAESFAALNRHIRRGSLASAEIQEALDGINADWLMSRFSVMDITSRHLLRCQDLIFNFHLTSSDALILASALDMKIPQASPIFVYADVRSGLLRAAEASQLSTLNPLSP